MRSRAIREFSKRLAEQQVAPRHIARAVEEISDHIDDLYHDALADGVPEHEARDLARKAIGDLDDVAAAIGSRDELKVWTARYPRVASVCLPIAYLALLPTLPIYVGVQKAPVIARWSACVMLGALVTAAMFLILQISILFA